MGRLYYRHLERFKIKQLKLSKGDFEAKLAPLPLGGVEEINWWNEALTYSFSKIVKPPVDYIITTDASLGGWGATDGCSPTGGRWSLAEQDHINVLELKSAYLAIKAYCKYRSFKHVKIRSDNSTAIAYINNMGGMKSLECDSIAKELWKCCSSRGFWVSATYIPGRKNVIADRMSREFNDQTEWMLNPAVFLQIIEKLKFFPMIDIFASRLNHQVDKYISWLPDPGSVSVDAFSISWSNINFMPILLLA